MLRKGYGEVYKVPKMEESERYKGERDQIKFIDIIFGLKKGKKIKKFHKLHVLVLGMNDDL